MFQDLLRQQAPGLSSKQIERLASHYEMMVRWNRVVNLTRIVSPDEALERHYLESLFLARHLPAGPLRVIDIGSGAGFPGIPVAISLPDCSVTLVESHQRKAAFLQEATRGWVGVRVVARRIETVEEDFDWALCRAVRWPEVEAGAARLAPAAAVLCGAEGPGGRLFRWDPPIPVPKGERRSLFLGHSVSRGT